MKGFPRLFLAMTVTIAILVSACGGSATSSSETSAGGNKPLASLIEVQGYIEGINGNQWTINGQVVTVDSSMLDDDDDLSDYQVGDYIEIKAEASTDGSLIAREIDSNSSDDGNENDDSNSNDDSNDNGDDSNSNDDDSNDNDDDDSNGNDDDSNNNDDNSDDNDDDSNNNDDSNDNDDDSNDNNDDSDDDDENENDD